MNHLMKIRTLMLTLLLLLGTMPTYAVERPFALKGAGVATLITDESGHLIGAIPTGSGTATHLGQWTVTGIVHYTPTAPARCVPAEMQRSLPLTATSCNFTLTERWI